MEHPDFAYNIGDEVISVDNRTLGEIVDIRQDRGAPGSLVVENDRRDKATLTIPVETIANAADGLVHLSISEAEATSAG